jgi:hypothetical protein
MHLTTRNAKSGIESVDFQVALPRSENDGLKSPLEFPRLRTSQL